MRDKFDLEHRVELAKRSYQIRDYYETLHVVSLMGLLEISKQMHKG